MKWNLILQISYVNHSPFGQHTKMAIFKGILKNGTKSSSIVSASLGGSVCPTDDPMVSDRSRSRSTVFKSVILLELLEQCHMSNCTLLEAFIVIGLC